MGYSRVSELAGSMAAGRLYTSHFRKNPPHTTVAGNWYDMSVASGYPRPNYYAASPLTAKTLEAADGIYHGENKSPQTKHVARWSLCSPTAGAIGGPVKLLDYLLYYPFVDGDAVGEDQNMINYEDNPAVPALPRYATGEGVYAMAVCVAPTIGGGSFTVNYVDGNGVARTSPVMDMSLAALNIATLATCTVGTVGAGGPFLQLGNEGIRRITRVNMISASGGLFTIVLVRPIATSTMREVSTAREVEFLTQIPGPPQVLDGAYLNMIIQPTASLSGGVITGHLDFPWSA
ncbi:MAG: hypothetical protein ACRCUE_09420 [Bosea sp. (in: a-proteobacteria)]